MCRFDLSFVHVACHGYVLHMFPSSWHLSLTGRKHYALLFADHLDRIQAERIHPLLGWLYMISSFIRTRILHRPHLFCNTFIARYFLIATLWTLFLGNRCNAKYLEGHWVQNFTAIILPWALHYYSFFPIMKTFNTGNEICQQSSN
jgi:hypothetical protein